MRKISLHMLLALITMGGFISFQGCSEDDPEDFSIQVPGVGSTYIYNEYETEDGTKIDSTEQTVTAELKETGLSYSGKTDVLHFQEIGTLGDTTETYLKYESNNDVSIWLDFGEESGIESIEGRWMVMPFGSRTGESYTLIDTVAENDEGGMDTLKMTVTTSFVREETAQYNGKDLKVWVGKINLLGSIPFPFIGQATITGETLFYFAPEIGYVYKSEDESETFGSVSGTIRVLTSYTLK